MPRDGAGNYRHNDQAARAHGGMKEPKLGEKSMSEPKEPKEAEGEHDMTMKDHGDGTFTTTHKGEEPVEHESIGHMHAHISSHHGAPGESHFHAHHDGVEGHSHSVKSGEEPEHRDNEDTEGMKEHLGESMGEGGEHELGENQSEENSMGSLGGSAIGM